MSLPYVGLRRCTVWVAVPEVCSRVPGSSPCWNGLMTGVDEVIERKIGKRLQNYILQP